MLWEWFQLLIIGLVMSGNVVWHWTPNHYLAGYMGVAAAWIVTLLLTKLFDLLALRRRQRHDRPTHEVAPDIRRRQNGGSVSAHLSAKR
jgi:hypothetical protein